MAFISLKEFLSRMGLATPGQFEEWGKAWRVAVKSGSQESLLGFICRETGLAEDVFLQQLAKALNWPYLELPKLKVPAEARNRISTKVAFQYSVLPTLVTDGAVQVAVSNPFDTAMLNAVRFDARGPVQFALATKVEIEKALKNFYGVGAETLGEMDQDEACGPGFARGQGNHRERPGSERHQVRQPGDLGGLQGPGDGHSFRTGGGRTAHPLPH